MNTSNVKDKITKSKANNVSFRTIPNFRFQFPKCSNCNCCCFVDNTDPPPNACVTNRHTIERKKLPMHLNYYERKICTFLFDFISVRLESPRRERKKNPMCALYQSRFVRMSFSSVLILHSNVYFGNLLLLHFLLLMPFSNIAFF